ncbi:MAG TPA: RES family NAD+ phosphorylase [Longimicrobiaceae bacterium]|nr:RES family NAD+ phosphorylase [Longimicrobiaceae bacterium]
MVVEPEAVPVSRVLWPSCYRIIPSRFPPVQLFERVADPVDLEAVLAIEALTNDRVRDEVGLLRLVAPEDRVTGAGAGYVMAAFTHVSPMGGRFTDGTYGAYYTARDLHTAIDETVHHRERFLRATAEGPMELDMRVLRARLSAELHDVRGMRDSLPEIYHPDDYSASQALARRLRAAGSRGVAYDSVRRAGGECAAVFRPRAISRCQQTQRLAYVWDGSGIAAVYEKRMLRP